MTKQLVVPKIKTYKLRKSFHSTNNLAMTEDKEGNWVRRSDAENLADLLQQAYTLIADLEASQLAVKLPDLNKHLIAILGRPNFTCCHLAELLRGSGVEIRRKSENEQATVIHYLLNFYLEYGDKWESIAKEDIQSKVATQTASGTVQGDE